MYVSLRIYNLIYIKYISNLIFKSYKLIRQIQTDQLYPQNSQQKENVAEKCLLYPGKRMNTASFPSLLPILAFFLLSIFSIALLDWNSELAVPWKRNGNIVVVTVVGVESADDTRKQQEGVAGPHRCSWGSIVVGDKRVRRVENGDERRGENEVAEEAMSGVAVGRAAQACASSRLESRRIPKRNTPLRPRHGSHASVSSD